MRLLLLGATGLVGRTVLSQALAKDAISEVVAPTRRPLVLQNKLVNPVNLRLDELAPRVKSWDVDAVICALGTTKAKAGSKEAFRFVDYTLPLVFAKAAHEVVQRELGHEFLAENSQRLQCMLKAFP